CAASVEDCCLAVGNVVGHENIVSASRMNSAIVVFLNDVEKVRKLTQNGIVVNNEMILVSPLSSPAKKVMLSNVPPFISDEAIGKELSRYGRMVSPIKKIPLGCKSPLVKHLVSFRRMVFMLLKKVSPPRAPEAAAAPDLTESEPQAQPAAQTPTGATSAPEKPRTAEPAAAEPRSARPDRKKPWSTEKSSVGSGAVLEPPALTEAGAEVQGNRMETPDTTPVQGDGGDVDMADEPVFKYRIKGKNKYTLNVTRDIVRSLKALEIEIVELQRLEATGDRGHIEALKTVSGQGHKWWRTASSWACQSSLERAARELDRELSLEELHEALQRMENGRASGIDGLPAEFYKAFWAVIGQDVLDVPTGQYTERAREGQTEQVEAAGPEDVLQGANAGYQQPRRVVPLAQTGMRRSAAEPASKHPGPVGGLLLGRSTLDSTEQFSTCRKRKEGRGWSSSLAEPQPSDSSSSRDSSLDPET
ncbi:hypothetical protein QTP86_027926, partial [Hemibagrus guttatus]